MPAVTTCDDRPAPTGSRSPRTSTWLRPRRRCRTCTSSASTGCTCRRCWPGRDGQRPRLRRRPTTGRSTLPRTGVRAWRRWPRGGARGSGMGVLVDIVPNHVGVARPWENEWWWHVLTHGQESPYAERLRHRLGRRRRQAAHPGRRRRRPAARRPHRQPHRPRRRAALPRPALPAGAGHRPGGRRGSQRRPRPAALRADQLARGGQQPELPAVLRREHPCRAAGGGPGVVRPSRTPRSSAGSTRASWTACASTIPTACATPASTSTTSPPLTGGATCWWRRSSRSATAPRARRWSSRNCRRRPGRPPAPPATTRWR